MKEALFYKKEETNSNVVICYLCSNNCTLKQGQLGICGVRKNIDGTLYSLSYGKLIAINPDPIEKKPLFHFQPASRSLSIASEGCNLKCPWCQNYHISVLRGEPKGEYISPQELIKTAKMTNCSSISYTYTEPIVHFEFFLEVGIIAREHGLKNIFVTNGTFSKESCKEALKFLDGANIDLKVMDPGNFKKFCKGNLQSVLDSIEFFVKNNVWIEVTTLLVPTVNDDEKQLRSIAKFLVSISPYIPWHITRFHPDYKFTHVPPTPPELIEKGREIGLEEGLKYVYSGNLWGDPGENTYCPNCKSLLIKRIGFNSEIVNLKNSKCKSCGELIRGVDLP